MANEITMTAKLKLTNGELVVPELSVIGKTINQATSSPPSIIFGRFTCEFVLIV